MQIEVEKLNGYNDDLMNEAEQLEIDNARTLEALEVYKKQLMAK